MKFILKNHHILIELEHNIYLVNTGSLLSFSYKNVGHVQIGKNEYLLSHNYLIAKNVLDMLCECDISGVIGLDIIKNTGLTLDYQKEELEFKVNKKLKNKIPMEAQEREKAVINHAIIVNDRVLTHTIIDTGAWVSYVAGRFLNEKDKTSRSYIDISPTIGRVSGFYYKTPVEIQGVKGSKEMKIVDLGVLHPRMELQGYDGILSPDVLSNEVSLDYENKIILLR